MIRDTNITDTVAFFGDWHANLDAVERHVDTCLHFNPNVKRIVQVGDFGFWPEQIMSMSYQLDKANSNLKDVKLKLDEHLRGYVHNVDMLAREHDVIIYVILGNHEAYAELDKLYQYWGVMDYTRTEYVEAPAVIADKAYGLWNSLHPDTLHEDAILDEDGFITSPWFPNIRIAPRAHVWNWDGVQYASLGGATSIDVSMRAPGRSWWPQEHISRFDVESFKDLIDQSEHTDVLITHDAPIEVSRRLYGHGERLPREVQIWAEESGHAVQEAAEHALPVLNVCGHHHVCQTYELECSVQVDILASEMSEQGNWSTLTTLLEGE